MLAARLGTAAVLVAAILAALFWLPSSALAVLVSLIGALGAHEWARLCGLAGGRAVAYAALAGASILVAAFSGTAAVVIGLGAAFWIVAAPAWLWRGVASTHRTALLVAGFAVVAPFGLAVLAMTPLQVVLAVALTSIADSAAYFSGRAFGRHKLAPSISPGKTWEGVYGALAATVVYAVACQASVPQLREAVSGAAWAAYLGAAIALCVLGIVGDLFESALKRQAGAKDSGRLLPGHGGILDRIDSATATLPIAAGLWALIGGK